MKIVHICLDQYSDGWTYQENLLTKYHRLQGHDVSVITSMLCYRDGKLAEDTRTRFTDINGVEILRLKKRTGGLLGKTPAYKDFYETLCSLSPDIIFSHGCQYTDTKYAIRYVREHPQVRLFVDNHGDFTNSATNFLSREILHKIIWRHYAQQLVPYTEVFWGVLPARVDFLTELYGLPPEKCRLLVMGADDELVEKAAHSGARDRIRRQYHIADNDFLVMTGGKIDPWKAQTLTLMEAVRDLPDVRLKLLVFGHVAPELRDRFDRLIDGEKLQYAGWVQAANTYDYAAAADLFVFPGRHSVLWEQVAGQGVPMLVKDWPGTHHIDMGGNVRFLIGDSVEEIQGQLLALLEEPDAYRQMKEAAARGSSDFLYSRIAEKSISSLRTPASS